MKWLGFGATNLSHTTKITGSKLAKKSDNTQLFYIMCYVALIIMKQLYEVRTKRYKSYYVMAKGYDEAKYKAEQAIIDEDSGSILTEDGSLKQNYDIDAVSEIKCLSDKLIL